jgi:uncharacterized glyoxalase superfamily protein PhnB
VRPSRAPVFGGHISIATYADIHSAEDPAQTDQVAFGRVAAIVIPLAPAAFAALYGMLTDRFGVTRIVGVETPQANCPSCRES